MKINRFYLFLIPSSGALLTHTLLQFFGVLHQSTCCWFLDLGKSSLLQLVVLLRPVAGVNMGLSLRNFVMGEPTSLPKD